MSLDIYSPREDSVAGRCIAYFRRLPEEELSAKDISLKFNTPSETVHQLLKQAVEYDRLKRDGVIYSAGEAIGGIEKAVVKLSDSASPPRRRAEPRHIESLDLATLKVESDIPVPAKNARGISKWDPLFEKLTAAGQSIAFPASYKDAVTAELHKRHKLAAARYRTARTSTTEARIWRTA